MRDAELQRVADVTGNFFFWQGLRWAALGVAMVVGIVAAERLVTTRPARVTVLAAAAMLGFAVSCAAGRYYARAYGRVRSVPGHAARREQLKWNVVYPLMLVSLLIDAAWKGPILLSGPVWAAAILAYRKSTGGGRLHYLVIAGVLAASMFLPRLMEPGRATINFFFALIGGAYAIGGILDHFELRRILHAVPKDPNAAAV